MRRLRVALVAGVTALITMSCVPKGHQPARRTPPRSAPRYTAQPAPPTYDISAAHRLCLAQLTSDGARYNQLPDRVFGGGCSAIGTVQLTDIGMPTTNLGAMTCPLADAFTRWTRDAAQKAAAAWLSSPVVKIESFGTYSCRPINNVEGNKLSEHGLSDAVDISGFVLADGRRITVLDDWNGPDEYARNFLRAVHDAGCRRFHVVLGPDANALHRNHLHFDMGPGVYCK
ncbi:extensin family protein [uncultured Sphingomonas sp.]|uniref:extensin-like domain-containing protein n=1 Tax=uncultured Sphingomonas sp. TaxID=158754 RepID=UPI002633CE4D|nr:extensin family protein [uncultured Sphingomonas sp.]